MLIILCPKWLKSDIKERNKKLARDKTWTNFETHFTKAYGTLGYTDDLMIAFTIQANLAEAILNAMELQQVEDKGWCMIELLGVDILV